MTAFRIDALSVTLGRPKERCRLVMPSTPPPVFPATLIHCSAGVSTVPEKRRSAIHPRSRPIDSSVFVRAVPLSSMCDINVRVNSGGVTGRARRVWG